MVEGRAEEHMSSDAKSVILDRIRKAQVALTPSPDPVPERPSRNRHEVIDQFVEYVEEYRASVTRVSELELAEAIGQKLSERNSATAVIPFDIPDNWMSKTVTWVRDLPDRPLTHTELDKIDAVLTGSAVSIAETGTVVLDGGFAQGRRALTLIPDHHVCVVFADQVVDGIPEAVAKLEGAVRAGRPLTMISGPSATSDIELSRVEGVHGPRKLDIILVE
jgi:L-lactate dehydrogenase complex protein LldG